MEIKELKGRGTRFATGGYVLKILFIIGLALLFLIPLTMVRQIVLERQARSQEAEREIMAAWGGRQTIAGPFIAVPYTIVTRENTEKGEIVRESDSWFYLTPEKLDVEAGILSETRVRGIYEIPVYQGDILLSGRFGAPAVPPLPAGTKEIRWAEARLVVELPETRSVMTGTRLIWNGRELDLMSGIGVLGLFDSSLQGALSPGWERKDGNLFSLTLKLRGAGSVSFIPFGKETDVRLASDWHSPSFNGAFLPSERELEEGNGFSAVWSIHALARSFPLSWKAGDLDRSKIHDSAFGVNLFEPVGLYAGVERAVKYGMLFIILPFIAFFMMEVFTRGRIHILQYLMVGAANIVFYLLLLSVSEQLGFDAAYILGAAATSILIAFYSRAIAPVKRYGLLMAPVMAGLYVFLYTVLQSEDYALLIGSVGLFVLLALVMVLTRRVDWYGAGRAATPGGADVDRAGKL